MLCTPSPRNSLASLRLSASAASASATIFHSYVKECFRGLDIQITVFIPNEPTRQSEQKRIKKIQTSSLRGEVLPYTNPKMFYRPEREKFY
jgi:hypothetical protein